MLDSIGLSNFKAFQQIALPLSKLTLLAGWNSSGKSTVLQAVAALRQSHEAGLLATEGLLLNGPYVELGTGRDVLHEDHAPSCGAQEISIRTGSSGGLVERTFRYSPESDLLGYATPATGDGRPAAESFLTGGFQFLHAERVGPAAHYPRSHRTVGADHALGVKGEHTANYLRVHQGDEVDDRRRAPDSAGTRLMDQVSAWMRRISPGVNLEVTSLENTDLFSLSYGHHGTVGLSSTNRRRATNVGFGLTYTLPLVVAALASAPGSLLLVEHPEAHLHPRGQAAMAHLLVVAARSGVQTLVESHSDHFLNGLRVAVKRGVLRPADVRIHFFGRGNGEAVGVASPVIGAEGMLSEWPLGFFDEWDRALAALLG